MQNLKNTAVAILQVGFWPAFLALWFFALFKVMGTGLKPVNAYSIVYFSGMAVLFIFERLLPYNLTWKKTDNQWFNDLVHTVFSRAANTFVLRVGGAWFTLEVYAQFNIKAIWAGVPLWAQIVFALLLCDLGRYIYHRFAHERWGGWAFHSIHHSARRLWVGNTGRTHFIDGIGFVVLGFIPLYVLQLSPYAIFAVLVCNSFVGTLAHCNIKMRLGPLDYIFNTPLLHRWHHSKVISEGNRNYGLLFCVWDHVFGTYYNPNRLPPEDIGTRGTPLPDNLFKQLYYPLKVLAHKRLSPWHYIGERRPNETP